MKLELKTTFEGLEHVKDNYYGDAIITSVENAIDKVARDYSGDVYVCDAISESADYNVSIWNRVVLQQAEYLDNDIADVLKDGLADPHANGFSLVSLLRCAWYEVIYRACMESIPEIIYNFAVNLLNDLDVDFEPGAKLDAMLDEITDIAFEQADSDSTFEEIEEAVALAYADYLGLDIQELESPIKVLDIDFIGKEKKENA